MGQPGRFRDGIIIEIGDDIGITESSIRLWSGYEVARMMFFEAGLRPEVLEERFRSTLGEGLANPIPELPDLPR